MIHSGHTFVIISTQFDRYIIGSIKEDTQKQRQKGVTKVFKIMPTSRLPTAKVLLTVTENKLQLINFIIKDLIDHSDEEVKHSLVLTGPKSVPFEVSSGTVRRHGDLKTTKEEVDTIIIQQVKAQ